MEMYFKRFFWVVPIVVVTLCSLIAAQAATHILAASVLGPPPKARSRAKKPPKAIPDAAPPLLSKDDAAVTARNLFCSSCDPAAAKPADPAAPAPPPPGSGVPLTSAPVKLVATLVASEPALSTASIVNTQTFRTGSYRPEDVIPAVGKVKKIRPNHVDFENLSTGRLERVELSPAGQPAVAAAPTQPPPPTPLANPQPPVATPDSEFLAEMDKAVKKIDDTHYDIDRALVEKVMNDTSLLSRAARIVPSIQGGKNNGFKLYAIRPNSPFARLGLQNGDTMQAVNGFEVTGIDKALEVLTKVRSASNLSVQILRRGQPVTMEYNIR